MDTADDRRRAHANLHHGSVIVATSIYTAISTTLTGTTFAYH